MITNKPNTDKTIEQIKNEGAAKHSSVYTDNDFRIRAAVGFECGFDAALKICEQRERDLVDAIEKSIAIADDYADSGISKPIRLALKKHREKNEVR